MNHSTTQVNVEYKEMLHITCLKNSMTTVACIGNRKNRLLIGVQLSRIGSIKRIPVPNLSLFFFGRVCTSGSDVTSLVLRKRFIKCLLSSNAFIVYRFHLALEIYDIERKPSTGINDNNFRKETE